MNIRELQAHELQALLALYVHLHERDDPLPSLAEVEAVWSEALASPRTPLACRDRGAGPRQTPRSGDGSGIA